jgi:hypothetical protein
MEVGADWSKLRDAWEHAHVARARFCNAQPDSLMIAVTT